ncbi:MAG: phosphoribosylformylglycinamidine cyclo-ligase [Candidatus Aquicultorales bacterium]
MSEGATYRQAGVDIGAGDKAVELMKESIAATMRPEVIGGIGGFGGLFELPSGYRKPVLVGATDGVGTKLKVAQALDEHSSVGIDLVAMCVNDVLVQGAEPLFFLDYLATGKLEPEKAATVVSGVARGCEEAGCALLGGETAEMPGFYAPGEYDLAGFAVGVVDKESILDGSSVAPGDVLLGIPSNGLHSNGFSLVRYLVEREGIDLSDEFEQGRTLGEELLRPTAIYVKRLLPLAREGLIKAMAHITGGGITNNLPRVLPAGRGALVDPNSWEIPGVFKYLQRIGEIDDEEMLSTFNMGLGMILVVDRVSLEAVEDRLAAYGGSQRVGVVEEGDGKVRYGHA